MGTKDRDLCRVVISRCEKDMVQIKQEYQRLYGKSLAKDIKVVAVIILILNIFMYLL